MADLVKPHGVTWALLVVGFTLAACETMSSEILRKNAQSEELRKETTPDVKLPSGCPTLRVTFPVEKKSATVCYDEPKTNQDGTPLTDLAFTTLYLESPKGHTRAIRVWTNNAHGGAHVTVSDVPIAGEVGACVTATDWARNESPPGTNAPNTEHCRPR